MTNERTVRIGGGSGYWGDADLALPQLLDADVDYVVFDYLAEITMSIMARARARSPDAGYATDFVTAVLAPNLEKIAGSGVKILANAGGVNPSACTRAIEELVREKGLSLTVATVTGDDLTSRAAQFTDTKEMFSNESFPDVESIASINAYLGAFPIADALDRGADIIVTGRCVDSALALAVGIHEFKWQTDDWDKLAAGSMTGHLIECGNQVAGGNYTDWREVADSLDMAGYPIAEITEDGAVIITKPEGSGGVVNKATVAEQLLYEIGDPAHYLLPDVVCDFTQVVIQDLGNDSVSIDGAMGRPAPGHCKVSATFTDGWRIISLWFFIGKDSITKANAFAQAAISRSKRKLTARQMGDFTEVAIETFGAGSHFHDDAPERASREVTLRISARHPNPDALTMLLKETSGLALATPPGMALYTGGRPSPSPVFRLYSFLLDKQTLSPVVDIEGVERNVPFEVSSQRPAVKADQPLPDPSDVDGESVTVPLRQIAWARSGDKGNNANIGVIPRNTAFAPYLWAQLDNKKVEAVFAHFLEGEVERFYLPGIAAMNIVLHDVLGGGGMASLRTDTQGKSYAEILLDANIELPSALKPLLLTVIKDKS